jgi:hypothetical protein
MTPLMIQIGLHYHAMTNDFRDLDAPAIRDGIAAFVSAGLLRLSRPDDQFGRAYQPTDGLRVWVEALCAVPWPERVWRMPESRPQPEIGRCWRLRADGTWYRGWPGRYKPAAAPEETDAT